MRVRSTASLLICSARFGVNFTLARPIREISCVNGKLAARCHRSSLTKIATSSTRVSARCSATTCQSLIKELVSVTANKMRRRSFVLLLSIGGLEKRLPFPCVADQLILYFSIDRAFRKLVIAAAITGIFTGQNFDRFVDVLCCEY